MALDVGLKEEYRHTNKITSKLVHPTTFSILTFQDKEELARLKPILFNSALRFFLEIYNEMKEHIDRHGIEPTP
jgi:hypothetical protein